MQLVQNHVSPGHTLPRLEYSIDALEPFMSKQTLENHYGIHHRGYVHKLNALIEGTNFEGLALLDIVKQSSGAIYNNAAQVWNHNLFWRSVDPNGGGDLPRDLGKAIARDFGSVHTFKQFFKRAATEKFGSGWIWLTVMPDGRLAVRATDNADTPIRFGERPLLVCDVWEHAYYLDFHADRARYVDTFWKIANWPFVEDNLFGRTH